MKKVLILTLAVLLTSCSINNKIITKNVTSETHYIHDESRNRSIPIETYRSEKSNNEVVILNAGYGCSATEYSYITKNLAGKGYLVIGIQHELQTDEYLPSGENIYEARLPNWEEGIKNINSTIKFLSQNFPSKNFEKLNLIGHSNGGDIAMLYATNHPDKIKSIITLDHRRMPIPRTNQYEILSIRADQFPADFGVLPNNQELGEYSIKIVNLDNVAHDYLRDNATKETKEIILEHINKIL